jgi:hypothetical protein
MRWRLTRIRMKVAQRNAWPSRPDFIGYYNGKTGRDILRVK